MICTVLNPKEEFKRHVEFLKDRMAANYISFTLLGEEGFNNGVKD